MTVTVKKTINGEDQIKEIQTENLAYYKEEGWVVTESVAPVFKKAKRRFEDKKEEE